MHKELVDRIHKEKAKNDSNSRDLASTLNVLSKTVFGEVNRFIFELLQNADDSSSDENPISVEFQLLENYLVFSHDGKHFTEEDVMGISSIGSRISDKDKNIEKTGYKGIGFKSVFGTSDYAHIVSGGFSFRFDKNFEGYTDPEEYPWQGSADLDGSTCG
jgi:sacsin